MSRWYNYKIQTGRKRETRVCNYCERETAIGATSRLLAPHVIMPGVKCRGSGTIGHRPVFEGDKNA